MILDLALTMVLYLGVPLLIRKFSKSVWTKKKRRLVVFCNAIVVYLLFVVLYLTMGIYTAPNIAATVVWSWLALYILKHWNLNNNDNQNTKSNPDIFDSEMNLAVNDETYEDSADKKFGKINSVLILLSFLFILSFSCSIYFYFENRNLNAAYKEQSSLLHKYEILYDQKAKAYSKIRYEYQFYHQNTVIVSAEDNHFHKYGCFQLDGDYGIAVYNISDIEKYGFTPCSDCFGHRNIFEINSQLYIESFS